jgi:DNA-binding NarL/FixJ family response regulator
MLPVRVLIFDEQRSFAEALAVRLESVDEVRVVAVESRMPALLLAVSALHPDVVTIDVQLASSDFASVARQIQDRFSSTRVLVVSAVDDVDAVVRALWAGVVGWVPKDAPIDALVRSIRGAVDGEARVPSKLLAGVLSRILEAKLPEPVGDVRLRSLTERETEVLQCMVNGLTRVATAHKLALSPNTVRTHAQSILAKLGAHSSPEAVSIALAAGVRPVEP